MFNKAISIFFLCFLLSIFSKAQNPTAVASEDTNRIYWSDQYRLEWNDFQDEPDESVSIAALSSIALPYGYSTDGEGEIMVNIDVCFVKDESWAKEEDRNSVLLQHEQLHFDIAELHRRKVIKALLEANFTKNNYKEKVEEIMQEYWKKQYRSMQDKYDKETNYSQVFKEQIRWNKLIQQELKDYEEYTLNKLSLSLINFED